MISVALALAALLPVLPALADPEPSEPAPGSIFNEGATCHVSWVPDPSSDWTEMNIQLMTGDNLNMVHLTTVATVDGTDPSNTSFDYPCPAVDPNSAIYFYQFTSPASSGVTWTGRFAIASASGETTPPPESTQPNGDGIPWGTGRLENPGSATPPPPYLGGGGGGGASATGGPTANSTTITPSVPPTAVPTTIPTTSSTLSTILTTSAALPRTRSPVAGGAQGSTTDDADAPESTANGAVSVDSSRMMTTGAALAAVALVFTALL